ncbi:ROK family transcriptional regulator [Frigoribacterium sp. CFBP9039]|uniref:ROK family transcriptional regulator n=1 Tax=Frigoribacterium sp. CFBP9029 TaxID=3096541 RepID=UPI002A6B0AEA|nr:ROK family transcriptional regulator [Frigoribacterium sp. CFBP9039]MDY0945251.1 ROK family transcriptional regulator [Frigoribacterium sp. CFBP9039]
MVNPRPLLAVPTSRALAFDLIRSQGPISRVELAESTGLTQATMSNVVRQLLLDGLVVESGRRESTGGKPRVLLTIDPRARYALGVQLGADFVTVVLTDLGGALVGRSRVAGVWGQSPESAVAWIASTVSAFLESIGVEADRVTGLGLVTPGPIDLTTGSILGAPPFEEWAGFPLREATAEATGFAVILDNDATAAAIGEFWGGAVGDSAAHCTVYFGAGIGAGIVLDGAIYRGASSNAGELGQMRYRGPGPVAHRVSAEQLAGPVSVALGARAAVAAGRATSLVLTDNEDPFADFTLVAEAAVEGDALAVELITESADHLANAVVSMANLLDLDSVVLAGPSLTTAGPLYLEVVRQRIADDFFAKGRHRVRVELSAYVADAAAVGGAALVLQREVGARRGPGGAGAGAGAGAAGAAPVSPV